MIHEMNQVVWVTNETLGDGVIMAILDYGIMQNSVLMVGFESGDIKFLDTNQVKLTRNDTLGIGVKPKADCKFNLIPFEEPKWSMTHRAEQRDKHELVPDLQEQLRKSQNTRPLVDPQLIDAQRERIAKWDKRLHSLEVKSALFDDILKRLTKLEKKAKQ